jgi:hypothetical protein
MYIKEEQTTQWPTEKVQKDKQRSTKHTYKTIDRVTRTSLKTHILSQSNRRRTPIDGKSSHCLWQGELKRLKALTCFQFYF